jgi:hypothetical protein
MHRPSESASSRQPGGGKLQPDARLDARAQSFQLLHHDRSVHRRVHAAVIGEGSLDAEDDRPARGAWRDVACVELERARGVSRGRVRNAVHVHPRDRCAHRDSQAAKGEARYGPLGARLRCRSRRRCGCSCRGGSRRGRGRSIGRSRGTRRTAASRERDRSNPGHDQHRPSVSVSHSRSPSSTLCRPPRITRARRVPGTIPWLERSCGRTSAAALTSHVHAYERRKRRSSSATENAAPTRASPGSTCASLTRRWTGISIAQRALDALNASTPASQSADPCACLPASLQVSSWGRAARLVRP